MKSSLDEIRERFDNDVERFANLETGQSATIDAPLALELVARAASAATPGAKHALDIGCGAGNFTLRLLQAKELKQVTLVDLSLPMLARAASYRGRRQLLSTIARLYQSLTTGGSIWIVDLVTHPDRAVQSLMWNRYGEYLASIRDARYRDHVFDYIDKEDSPRPLMYQLNLLQKVGFSDVDVLHYNTCFAAFGAVKR